MKGFKMSYSNGLLSESTSQGGKDGKDGLPGVGFKLTSAGDFDLQGKRLTNVAGGTADDNAVTKKQIATKVDKVMTDDLDANSKKIKNVSQRTDADAFPLSHGKSLFLTINNSKFDAKKQQITNLVTNTADKTSAVNVSAMNLAIANSSSQGTITRNIDLTNQFNVLNSKQRTLAQLKTNYDSLVSFEEVKTNFLSRVEEFPMGTQLDMNNKSITNLKTPVYAHEAATKGYADGKLALTGGRMTGTINMGTNEITNLATPTGNSNAATKKYADDINTAVRTKITQEKTALQNLIAAKLSLSGGTMSGAINMGDQKITNLKTPTNKNDAATKDFVEKSHVSQSGIQKNEFLYLMTNVNESSSQTNITVTGILTFPATPHTIFKKAYKFTMTKDAQNGYDARLGFHFYKLPVGAYTFVVEYFPPTSTNVSVDCLSTSINVNKQIFKQFPGYYKNVVQLHKWKITPPEYLMVDIKCDGDASSPASGTGWMIVYGISGRHNDVPSRVLDTQYITASGEMQMQVGINMKNFPITNLPSPISTDEAASKGYVDSAGIYSILNWATATYIDGYIKENAECMYLVERGGKDELIYNLTTRTISTLFDKTLSGLGAVQTVVAQRPVLSTTKNAKRYSLKFTGRKRMISNINLNPPSGGQDLVHVFILFKLKFRGTGQYFRNGLFGHDNGGWDKFVAFTPNTNNLIISGTNKDGSEYNGGFNAQVTASDWQTKADASELNKWCCMSIHWDVPAGNGKSSCWVNGKKVKSFTARTSAGSNQMTFGDLDPNGIAGLNGNIQLFLLYKGFGMADLIIKAHHKMLCERFYIDHDPITFL